MSMTLISFEKKRIFFGIYLKTYVVVLDFNLNVTVFNEDFFKLQSVRKFICMHEKIQINLIMV